MNTAETDQTGRGVTGVSSVGQTRSFRFVAEDGTALSYLLHLPPGHHEGPGGWPLILFLHGAGERGEDPQVVLREGLPKRLLAEPAFPAVVLMPQCAPKKSWLDYAQALLELLDDAEKHLGTDPRRVHLTGLSLGGMGAWYLGARHAQRFASVVPICGSVPPFQDFPGAVSALRDTPVWAFHGVEDPVIPVAHTLVMVETLRRAGGHPRLTLYTDVGHTAWHEAYADPALSGWFLGTVQR